VGLEKTMSRRRGSFEDWNELLERFAHKGTPAALDDQLEEADAKWKRPGRECRSFRLNQSLFDRSQG
jgi:hypothetical protein